MVKYVQLFVKFRKSDDLRVEIMTELESKVLYDELNTKKYSSLQNLMFMTTRIITCITIVF